MLDAIVYTDKEVKLINNKLSSPEFSGYSWEDDDLGVLRARIKKFYLKKQKNICIYCQVRIPSGHGRVWDVEHVICRSSNSYFMFEPRNLCVSCIDCNISKGDKLVTKSVAKRNYPATFFIVHPHFDRYEHHIKIIEAGKYYQAKTEKGEKTISICRLNRFYSVAGYEAEDVDLDEIQSLAAQLSAATTGKQQQEIIKRLAVAAIDKIK